MDMCLPNQKIEFIKEEIDVSRKILIQSIQRSEKELQLFKNWIKEKRNGTSK
jgi:hypothetical protein